jgi:hypothetical protein
MKTLLRAFSIVVVVVALTIECLVATFKAAHQDPGHLLYASSIVLSVGALLAGWGLFVRLNRYAEAPEPEAMAEAKHSGPFAASPGPLCEPNGKGLNHSGSA